MKPKKWLEPESRSQERRFANSRIINPAYVVYIEDFAKRAAKRIVECEWDDYRDVCHFCEKKIHTPDCIVLAAQEYRKQ